MASLARRAVAAAVGAAETAVHNFTTSDPPQTIVLALDASEMAEYAVHCEYRLPTFIALDP